ncbi:HD domain-containing protein [Candidatus Nitrosotenuis chungbukensis]|uniref:HD domain-containing protein n=1 Tax=Candidatus Nitrosotenuis chungbukensis TaxID=1353246 RepID=UPI0005B2A5D1|nr:HD domain-containing protein [Candidatus Nitrosotenuis chungbukensis]WKT57531.1 HD domain-containing protein [Candidatus Nitrosotenuis chungbukensis]
MLEDFLKNAMELKAVPRQGWINKLGLKNPESVADHCYSMAVLAMIFSDLKRLDTEKIIKMTLLHDLAESVTGDLTPEDVTKSKKEKLETRAMKKILAHLPKPLRAKYAKLWMEYQQNSTNEARLLHQIDKLEMALQAKSYEKKFTKKQLKPFFDSAKREISDPDLKKAFKKIL